MTDEQLRRTLAEIERWEGRLNYLYLDSRGNPTIGTGCLISGAIALEVLPMMFAGPPTRRATVDEKRAEFARVKALPFGQDRAPRSFRALPPAAILYLEDSAIDELAFRRLNVALGGLRRLCPGFGAFPDPAQVCLLDLAWNLGVGAPTHGDRPATGLTAFSRLLAACNAGDWRTAAIESHVSSSRAARNEWRAACFVKAAGAAA